MKCLKRRGFTLIEIIVSIACTLIIGGLCITLILSSIKEYNEVTNKIIYMNKLDNCLLNIDVLCNSNGIKDIRYEPIYGNGIRGDSIVITYYENYKEEYIKDKVIYLLNDKIMVKTLEGKNRLDETGNNVLIDNITSFKVYMKENLIYFYIKTKLGDEITRCI